MISAYLWVGRTKSAPLDNAHQWGPATDAATARRFGAEGIGLCRTEHMFFEADRIVAVRQMILADAEDERKAALAKLLPMQRSDFEPFSGRWPGSPVTIRLLDPPLHEFLPQKEEEFEEVAAAAEAPARKEISRPRHRPA